MTPRPSRTTPGAVAGSRRGARASLPTCGVCGRRFPQPPRGASVKTVSCGIGCSVTVRGTRDGRWQTTTVLSDGTTGTA